jgi:hypothetical protein
MCILSSSTALHAMLGNPALGPEQEGIAVYSLVFVCMQLRDAGNRM